MIPNPAPSAGRRLLEILVLAAAYFATGKLGLLLAIPPGYATAIWPPSGIALAVLLIVGSRAWPGVLLGSFFVNLDTSQSPAVAAVIGGGAAAQALTGAFLIRRFLGSSPELLRGRDVVKFLLLGGPASCVVGASVGVATLYLRKLVQVGEMPFSWWTWWAGDVIGVAVVAPMVLIALGEPREVWRRRAVPVGIPLAAVFLLAASLFFGAKAWERSRISSQFERIVEEVDASILKNEERIVQTLRSLESFHAATPQFDRKSFRVFAKRLLSTWGADLVALSWNPRVRDADRDLFERGGADGSDEACKITERDAKDRLVPAPRRSEYVPIRYIEPAEENPGVVGFDVASGIVRFEAIQKAGDEGKPVATRKIRLMQGREETGLIVYLPVYSTPAAAKTSVEERRRTLVGFFAAVIRLNRFFSFLEAVNQVLNIEVEIHETNSEGATPAASGAELLWGTRKGAGLSAEIQHQEVHEVWGRSWAVTIGASPAYVSARRDWIPWLVLAFGMSVAGGVGAVLLATTGRAVPQR